MNTFQVLIEIMASRTNEEILLIRQVYKKLYKNELEKDLKSETSGDFEHILVALCQVNCADHFIHECILSLL